MSVDFAIVNYGMGNLFSVQKACQMVGLSTVVTQQREDIQNARGILLPGVGAFGQAMAQLHERNLVDCILREVGKGKPIVGICLGFQLLMDRSFEFGIHEGLKLLTGEVISLRKLLPERSPLRVPQVGWNLIEPDAGGMPWTASPLEDLTAPSWMYFVHSFSVVPSDKQHILSQTTYGPLSFCSSAKKGNIIGFQFHPERSGEHGLAVYRRFKQLLKQ
jgi:imidazole glycerol-phosphate synthase subunit HisH